jgi:hypothetical protein
MIITVHALNADEVAAKLAARPALFKNAMRGIFPKAGAMLKTQVMANASGRPGPRVITGAYRRSWTYRAGVDRVTVGTNAPQGARLEHGFVGPDRLGRVYHQPPFPHAGPALDQVSPRFIAMCEAALRVGD